MQSKGNDNLFSLNRISLDTLELHRHQIPFEGSNVGVRRQRGVYKGTLALCFHGVVMA